jgi:hypothetical protein
MFLKILSFNDFWIGGLSSESGGVATYLRADLMWGMVGQRIIPSPNSTISTQPSIL